MHLHNLLRVELLTGISEATVLSEVTKDADELTTRESEVLTEGDLENSSSFIDKLLTGLVEVGDGSLMPDFISSCSNSSLVSSGLPLLF